MPGADARSLPTATDFREWLEGKRAFADETAKRGVYAYENIPATLGAEEEALFRADAAA